MIGVTVVVVVEPGDADGRIIQGRHPGAGEPRGRPTGRGKTLYLPVHTETRVSKAGF